MTSQEKRLKNAARECGEAIKAGVRPDRAIIKAALAYDVPWRDLDRAMIEKQTNGEGNHE